MLEITLYIKCNTKILTLTQEVTGPSSLYIQSCSTWVLVGWLDVGWSSRLLPIEAIDWDEILKQGVGMDGAG